ncbi:cytochrome P450 [Rhizorhapis sp.]|uniref:cytochrome P450 n=1 Tax=Rhizorhapis sp. TaxID=1968842 RepID=UPI002B46CD69|nr:cytochrome P450 [Rhizorhapis sp.]HKR18385.1 cytochrome P450 [Rhizorhapis sp.]
MATKHNTVEDCPVYEGDLVSPEALRDPFPHYRRIRDLGPVVRLKHPDVYAIGRFTDVQQALRLPEVLVSTRGIGFNDIVNTPLEQPPVIQSGGERHKKLRRVITKPLTPAALKEHREMLKALISSRLDSIVDQGEIDAVTTIARHLPLEAISRLVGLPEEGRANMLRWASASFNSAGPLNADGTMDPQLAGDFEIFREFNAYFREINPAHLRPGSWTDMLFQAAKAGVLSPEEARAGMSALVLPSLDTTIYAKGNLLYNLGCNPDQWALLRDNPALISSAVLEGVRYSATVRWFSRVAAQEYEVGEYVIPQGGRVMLLYGSANRDERHYPDPDRFDVTRNPVDQLGWGTGPHMCGGMHLAKLEMEVLLEAMIERVARIEVGSPVIGTNRGLYGFDSLPISLHSK